MPDIGMIDLVTPIQAGANIVAQANSIRRQREQMVVNRMEAQARQQEIAQRGELLKQQALQRQQEIQTEKHDEAQRALFSEDWTKRYTQKSQEELSKPEDKRKSKSALASEAFMESFHLLPGKDVIPAAQGIMKDAESQDRNQRLINDALMKLGEQEHRLQVQSDYWNKIAELRDRQAAESERSHAAIETLKASKNEADANAKKLERQLRLMGMAIQSLRNKSSAGQKAEQDVLKSALPGDPSVPRRAREARMNVEAPFDQQLAEIAKLASGQSDAGNVDTEANATSSKSPIDEGDENEPLIAPTPSKTAPVKPEKQKVKTKAERDALPSGTVYIGPDGKEYTKQ